VTEAITIVRARDEHAAGLIALIEPIFGEYEGVLFLLEELPELFGIATAYQDGAFWCAFRGETLVGSVGWLPADGGLELRKLYVARAERRHGLGDRLARLVEDDARARGARFIELWSDVKFTTAHRFYEARGYQRDGRTRELHDKSGTVEYYFRLDLG
jgi:putative acetyltransferase